MRDTKMCRQRGQVYVYTIHTTISFIASSGNFFLILVCLILAFLLLQHGPTNTVAQSVNDPNLDVELFVKGLSSSTSMAFLNSENILVLEKQGQVRLVSNGQLKSEPVLQVQVDTENERGLLGIAVMNDSNTDSDPTQNSDAQTVFLYYTESEREEDELRNRVYKYTWNGQTLDNATLLLDLPAMPGPNHDGGKLMIGPDNYIYGIIGDINRDGKLQNFPNGPNPDDTSMIFRVNPIDGSPAPDNPFSADPNNPLSKYYAYGIRNSFGLTFDPVTKNIWDTENGPDLNDEINLVKPGFNSGWQSIMGPLSASDSTGKELVNFSGSHYADPLLTWLDTVALTDIEFLESSRLGDMYNNNVFVGDNNNGNLYYFRVSLDRSSLIVDNIPDLVVDNEEEQSSIIFGKDFGSITDLETGPDGYLYVLSHRDPQWMDGVISRIVPSSSPIEEVTETVSPISPIGGQVQNEDDEDEDEEEEGSENESDENGDDEND